MAAFREIRSSMVSRRRPGVLTWMLLPALALTGLMPRDASAQSGLGLSPDDPVHLNPNPREDFMGQSVALGDFDGDGRDDIAACHGWIDQGQPTEGGVWIFYGGDRPTTGWAMSSGDTGVVNHLFCGALASGDFDGDSYTDLAVGLPRTDSGSGPGLVEDAGSVRVFSGSEDGLDFEPGHLQLRQGDGLGDAPGASDQFGSALAVGDFDGDTYDDLAVGVPYDDLGAHEGAARGGVHVVFGSAGGLSTSGDVFLWQGKSDLEGTSENGDLWGAALAAGNVDGDAYDDLVVGVPMEDVITVSSFPDILESVGAVHVLFGSADGPSGERDVVLTRDSPSVDGTAAADAELGAALAVGDLDCDGFGDVVVGVPGHAVGFFEPIEYAGAVQVLPGSAAGLDLTRDFILTQNSVEGESAGASDSFGEVLAVGDFDDDGCDDLAVGVPEDDPGATQAGAVDVLYGHESSFPAWTKRWHQGLGGLGDSVEPGDRVGWSLAAGEIDGLPGADLVIGVIGENYEARGTPDLDAGLVHVLVGRAAHIFSDGFETGVTSAWQ